ncbi:hypothetical protein GCM10010909_04100 [Acidocella aquatica]|uniref:TetR family transcriptional regulator n=1 Tax=Acidocella aquatica TaxID=1922313 RepID=A0ABQ6A268_9PROT|nr:TetR family transcriptional regulator [Acidocella aquatica]GLR65732.1 hypothetical protein GCM10010909_04100 [Acidocella aquatica]
MTETDFDQALVTAAFALGAEAGWRKVSPAAAALRAGLDLGEARARFSGCGDILRKFGTLADCYALQGALTEGLVRDRLFDTMLRRFDFLQMHRGGVVALLKFLPLAPPLAVCLAHATVDSMGWLLEAAGVCATGARGEVRKRGLALVWGYGVRAWLRDDSPDLAATMAAVDEALTKADALAARFSPPPKVAPAVDLPSPEAPSEVA